MITIPIYLAHGAGAGHQTSSFLQVFRQTITGQGYELSPITFQYMQEQESTGKKRPPPRFNKLVPEYKEAICHDGPVVVGGKSMGGRVASQLFDQDNVKAIFCLGFPFHPPGKQEKHRLAFLEDVSVPCLIIQGTRDAFGKPEWVNKQPFNPNIEIVWVEGADHDFNRLKKQGITQEATIKHICDVITTWLLKQGLHE